MQEDLRHGRCVRRPLQPSRMGIAPAASLQLLAVVPHVPPGLHAVEPMLEFDCTDHPIRQAILQIPLEPQKGSITIPQRPGLGVEVNRDALRRFAVNV